MNVFVTLYVRDSYLEIYNERVRDFVCVCVCDSCLEIYSERVRDFLSLYVTVTWRSTTNVFVTY